MMKRDCWLDITPALQLPELPNGCEVVSLYIVLKSLGLVPDKVELAENWLPKGIFHETDPNEGYLGDPATSLGWYCFPPVIVRTAEDWLRAHQAPFTARDLTGIREPELLPLLRQGRPVICWITMELAPPRFSTKWKWPLKGREYRPYSNLHCVVLTAVDAERAYYLDPLKGRAQAERERFFTAFEAMGRKAVAVG